MDYGFEHGGKVFTPNTTQGISAEENDARNKAIQAGELTYWQGQPSIMMAYFHLAADDTTGPKPYRATFISHGTVSTWLGTTIGTITHARVYRHNFGSRMVSMTVRGTNGATYHGRASYDWGQCIRLHRSK